MFIARGLGHHEIGFSAAREHLTGMTYLRTTPVSIGRGQNLPICSYKVFLSVQGVYRRLAFLNEKERINQLQLQLALTTL